MIQEFRRLTDHDIPAVIELTKTIWDGTDYMKNVIGDWIKDKKCHPFGEFRDSQLIGMGNIHQYTSKLAWLEGLRVEPTLQQKGIGRELFAFAVQYVSKHHFKFAQFDASSNTKGSLRLGEEFGFSQKYQVQLLLAPVELIQWDHKSQYDSKQILGKDAVIFIRKKLHLTEFCAGWAYFPALLKYFSNPEWIWFSNSNSILLQRIKSRADHDESPDPDEIRFILYGEILFCQELLASALENLVLGEKMLNVKDISLYCSLDFVPIAFKMGFNHPNQNGIEKETRVILHEKQFL